MSGNTRNHFAQEESREPVSMAYVHHPNLTGRISSEALNNSKHKFLIEWPESERCENGYAVGVCTLEFQYPENEDIVEKIEDCWIWEFPSKRLKHLHPIGPNPHTQILDSDRYDDIDLPNIFVMNVDTVREGVVTFKIGEGNLGVAFDGLRSKRLHLVFYAKRPSFDVKVWRLSRP